MNNYLSKGSTEVDTNRIIISHLSNLNGGLLCKAGWEIGRKKKQFKCLGNIFEW